MLPMAATAGSRQDEGCPYTDPAIFTGQQLPIISEAAKERGGVSTTWSMDCTLSQNAICKQSRADTCASALTKTESPYNGIISIETASPSSPGERDDLDLDNAKSHAVLGWIGYNSDSGVAYVFECCEDSSSKSGNTNFEKSLTQQAALTLSRETIDSSPTGPIAYLRHWKWALAQATSGDGYELQQRRHFKLEPLEKMSNACNYPACESVDQCIFLCLLCKLRFLRAACFLDHCSTLHKMDEGEERNLFTGASASAVLLPDFENGGRALLLCMEDVPWSSCEHELAKSDDENAVNKSEPKPNRAVPVEIPLVKSKNDREKGCQQAVAWKTFRISNGQAGFAFKHCDTATNSVSPEHSSTTSVSSPYSPYAVVPANLASLQPASSCTVVAQSRNSAKTLKCPKCNWHYKYHETLEIHMKEKHSDNEVSCVYCLTSQPHPRLARGENYICGYKPYRCDICRYSTTTKGNLAIHMQSDKHLNNAQELQQAQFLSGREADSNASHVAAIVGIVPCKSPPCLPAASGSVTGDDHLSTISCQQSNKRGPIFRCDICNYETCIARNLRIHMTSEKHSQNSVLLNQQSAASFEQCNGLTVDRMSAKLFDWTNAPPARSDIQPCMSTESAVNECEDGDEMLTQFAEKPESLAACFDVDSAMRPFQCCICLDFTCESVEEIVKHVSSDRTQANDSDVSHLAGNYVCNLCKYKTQLKANFALHMKTEKHLQRLQLMNHIQEGSMLKEWRLQFLNHTNPVQLRCVACNEFCDNLYKLQLHVTSTRHKYCLRALEKVRNGPQTSSHSGQLDAPDSTSDLRNRDQRALYCVLCRFATTERKRMFGHLLSVDHAEAVNEILASMEINSACVGAKLSDQDNSAMPDWIEERPCGRDDKLPSLSKETSENDFADRRTTERDDSFPSGVVVPATTQPCSAAALSSSFDTMSRLTNEDDPFDQSSSYDATPSVSNREQMPSANASGSSSAPEVSEKLVSEVCPLCQREVGSQTSMEEHLLCVTLLLFICFFRMRHCSAFEQTVFLQNVHSVTTEGVSRLLQLLPSSCKTDTDDSSSTTQNALTSNVPSGACYSSTSAISSVSEETNEGQKFSCPRCSRVFPDLQVLYAHQADSGHAEQGISPSGVLQYMCWWRGCSRYFPSVAAVGAHFREIHARTNGWAESRRFYCTDCDMVFVTGDFLRLHKAYHHNSQDDLLALAKLQNSPEEAHEQGEVTSVNGSVNLRTSESPSYGTDAIEYGQSDGFASANLSGSAEEDSNDDLLYTGIDEDELNSNSAASEAYNNDKSRQFRCHRCKMAFTRQVYLTIHNRGLMHRHCGKTQSMPDKYYSSDRPYKCELCRESFTQKSILLVHFNSVSHLYKLKKLLVAKASAVCSQNINQATLAALSRYHPNALLSSSPAFLDGLLSSISNGVLPFCPTSASQNLAPQVGDISLLNVSNVQPRGNTPKRFRCNICHLSYSNRQNLSVHLRSVAHQAKLTHNQGLVKSFGLNQRQLSGRDDTLVGEPDENVGLQGSKNAVYSQGATGLAVSPNASDDCTNAELSVAGPSGNYFDQDSDVNCTERDENLNAIEEVMQQVTLKGYSKPVSRTSWKSLLEEYGFEIAMQYNESSCRKLNLSESRCQSPADNEEIQPPLAKKSHSSFDSTASSIWIKEMAIPAGPENHPELLRCRCAFCDEEFSGVLILKAHVEQRHHEMVPEKEISQVVAAFRKAYERKRMMEQSRIDTTASVRDCEENQGRGSRQSNPYEIEPPMSAFATSSVDTFPSALAAVDSSAVAAAAASLFCASAANVGFGFGVPFPLLGLPFNPYTLPNPYVAGVSPLNSPMAQRPLDMLSSNANPTLAPRSSAKSYMPTNASTANAPTAPSLFAPQQQRQQQQQQQQQKRARTRITDDQLKILREYFDINNSPSEEQVEEMSKKSGLPQKVIKHWFRNTLFKERQRSKDSPYNFSIPPSFSIDLEEYEKTGEAKVIPLNSEFTLASKAASQGNTATDEPTSCVRADGQEGGVKTENSDPISSITADPSSPADESSPTEFSKECSVSSCKSSLTDSNSVSRANVDSLQDFNNISQGTVDSLNNLTVLFSRHDGFAKGIAPLPALQYPLGGSGSGFFSPCVGTLQGASGAAAASLSGLVSHLSAPQQLPVNLNCGGARRANRTRFTEEQVKVLQEFFEQNAYPKDDDLELLSKKLNLSPRVIVVWFQNARQKARKIYENQPPDSEDRFSRTPGLNYECKSCHLVFLRYYELIKHHKSGCGRLTGAKMDSKPDLVGELSPTAGSSKRCSSEEPYRQEEGSICSPTNEVRMDDQYVCHLCPARFGLSEQLSRHEWEVHREQTDLWSQTPTQTSTSVEETTFSATSGSSGDESQRRHRTKISPQNVEKLLAHYCKDPNPSSEVMHQIAEEVGISKRVVQVWYQNTRARERRAQGAHKGERSFNKRCPFCGILFHNKHVMMGHITERHAQQFRTTEVNIDCLPDAEEVPTISTFSLPTYLLAATTARSQYEETALVDNEQRSESAPLQQSSACEPNSTDTGGLSGDEAPLDLSLSVKLHNSCYGTSSQSLDGYFRNVSQENRQYASTSVTSRDEDLNHVVSGEDNEVTSRSCSPSPSSQQRFLAALARPQKRFRTHLTPSQVKVMRYLFQDYKTPTMSECEMLGAQIGLHKRVVQVWFQNARAKERKAIFTGGNSSIGSSRQVTRSESGRSSTRCALCNIAYTSGQIIQDHIFTKKHIDRVKLAIGEIVNSTRRDSLEGPSKAREDNRVQQNANAHADRLQVRSEGFCEMPMADAALTSSLTQNLIPYIYPAGVMPVAYYSGLPAPMVYSNNFAGFPSAGNLLYDPNINGTPVSVLQIPQSVRERIIAALKDSKTFVARFTQDGKTVSDLVKSLSAKDRISLSACDLEVGWSCRQCVTVFQSEHQFDCHKRLFCRTIEPAFKLVQTYYQCTLCKVRFAMQADFREHCNTAEHLQRVQ
ncbi:hypothetical protein M514_00355 [Trichuris suis]|uniref:Homeobox domain protein n=1 Tax=Trichuris suis TaxID=68888 RepID=A0A085NGM7_9BILA|nr:hypothetical protein M514_00355 [Trichuris suis]